MSFLKMEFKAEDVYFHFPEAKRPPQDDLSSCQVCLLTFNDGTNAPMLLICGHSYCAVCVAKFPLPMTCPLCRVVTPGQSDSLKKNYALIDVLPKLRPLKPEEACSECTAQATEFCVSCKALCKACSSKIHAYKALSTHTVVPIEAKDTLLMPKCADHGKKALLYCVADSSLICLLCKDHGAHKGHTEVLVLAEAAAKKVAELRAVIDRAIAAQRVERHTAAIMEAHEAMKQEASRACAAVQQYSKEAHEMLTLNVNAMLATVLAEEKKMDLAFTEQRFELARACSTLQTVVAQAEKVCKGTTAQILQAPAIVYPEVQVLSKPCFSSVEFKLSLPALPHQSVESSFQSCDERVVIEDAKAEPVAVAAEVLDADVAAIEAAVAAEAAAVADAVAAVEAATIAEAAAVAEAIAVANAAAVAEDAAVAQAAAAAEAAAVAAAGQ